MMVLFLGIMMLILLWLEKSKKNLQLLVRKIWTMTNFFCRIIIQKKLIGGDIQSWDITTHSFLCQVKKRVIGTREFVLIYFLMMEFRIIMYLNACIYLPVFLWEKGCIHFWEKIMQIIYYCVDGIVFLILFPLKFGEKLLIG